MAKFMYFDFRCQTCDAKSEQFVKPDVVELPCESPDCDGTTKRCISAPTVQLPGTDPDFPGEYAKWAKKNAKKRKEDKAFYERHGADKKHHSYGS